MTGAPDKIRLDQLLVERDWVETLEKAQRFIRAGQIRHGTRVLDKPGLRVPADIELELRNLRDRFVSRGGWKLMAALEAFPGLTPCPAVCADIGASTGGFTDCLLQHGAQKVYAIDVGTAQLDLSLRGDSRVVVMEKTNARFLNADSLPEPIDLVVTDVSFISLRLILPAIARVLRPEQGQAVVLVKPQFEAPPERVGKGGVVRDPATHQDVLTRVAMDFAPAAALRPVGLRPSPILGPAGNREYLLHLVNHNNINDKRPMNEDRIRQTVQEAFSL
jgi:23S rRNA (cytidine1920-2'-O)/16S rRNA (cytidine1409-2'-O)-methyltransferase